MSMTGTQIDASDATPLAGMTVAVAHAPWHSCGTHQVVVSQLVAYKSLGARVISIAVTDDVGFEAPRGPRWRGYLAATRDLPADARYFSTTPFSALATSRLLFDGWSRMLRGDHASWLIEVMKRAPIPKGIETEKIDLVHANHYFTMPFVERLVAASRVPIILESHDMQARQYVLRNKGGFVLPPRVAYEEMLATELCWMARASLCVHLNDEEHAEFKTLLPGVEHALVYPAVAPAAVGAGGRDLVIVASDNYANFLGLKWLFEDVLPMAEDAPVKIYGNICNGVRARERALFEANRDRFMGRVDDIAAVYASAGCILLPTLEGHGLSIKTVEALSSGAPLIATDKAFRGMGVDPASLANVTIANDAPAFAAAIRGFRDRGGAADERAARLAGDTRRLYERRFSAEAYAKALARVAAPLARA
jgi:glycosyltransferase involved in cell wall biosynthesis